MATLPTLYKRGKRNQTVQWSVGVEENSDGTADIVVIAGQVGGELQIFRKTIRTGKNLGKKNATTPLQQAMFEAHSDWENKQQKGYTEDPSGEIVLDYTIPMAALKYMERIEHVRWPQYAQPKLNGVRCVIRRFADGRFRYTSRTGKEFHGLQFLDEWLSRLILPGEEFDGELYRHGVPLQTISSLVRRSKNIDQAALQETIQLHIFDVINKDSFEQRHGMLASRFTSRMYDSEYVKLVPTVRVGNEAECEALMDQWLEQGYEGLMLRDPQSLYLANYRSEYLLKYKKFQDAEAVIVDVEQGVGKDEGTAIFVCMMPNENIFRCRMAATIEARREMWLNREHYKGKKITYRFQELTPYGIPEFPVGEAIRDYE